MASWLFRLGRSCYSRPWRVLIAWLVLLAAISGASATWQQGLSSQFSIPGTASEEAAETLLRNFPEQKNPVDVATVRVVVAAPPGQQLAAEPYYSALADTMAYFEAVPDRLPSQRFGNPVDLNEKLQAEIIAQETAAGLPLETAQADAANVAVLSPDGRIGFFEFDLDVPNPEETGPEFAQAMQEALDYGRSRGLIMEAGGSGYGEPLEIKTSSELIGIAVAFIVLLFSFGSLVAAGLPLLTAVIGISIGSAATLLATAWLPLNDTTPVLSVMLGLAVGIDYALFIMSRFRAEYRRLPRAEAAGLAVGTAGSAVVFAALTVIIALVGLSVVGIPFLSYMGLSAAFTVGVAVLVALTLLPALLGVAGRYAFGIRLPRLRAAGSSGSGPQAAVASGRSSAQRWIDFVYRFPGVVITAVVLSLAGLSLPVLHMHLGLPSDDLSEVGTTQRASADLMREGFGPGNSALLLAVIDAHQVRPDAPVLSPLIAAQPEAATNPALAAAQASFITAVQQFNSNLDVSHAQLIATSADGMAAQVLITPRFGPHNERTVALISALRSQEKQLEAATGATIGITGLTAIQQDVTDKLSAAMPLYLALVVGLSVVLLLLVFRSLLIPLIAGLGFLLSVGAAFGVTVLFWQDGFGGFVETPGPLISFMPIFLIGVTFGLAMDYQVFIVSRMREQFVRRAARGPQTTAHLIAAGDSAVRSGFCMGAPVVLSAALIMIAVFVAFIDQPLPFVKIFGFALAAGVLFDAFLVRMALVPAVMVLCGRATWWLPAWLDRLLPAFDVEGSALEQAYHEATAARQRADVRAVDALVAARRRLEPEPLEPEPLEPEPLEPADPASPDAPAPA